MENKKKRSKKVIIVVIVAAVIVFIAVIASVIGKMSKSMREAMEAMAGDDDTLFKVEKQDVEQEITTSGIVVGVEKVAYTSPVTAKVEDIRVEVGQMVNEGDVLLTYDASELGDNLEKVKIQVQSERAAGNESFEVAAEAADKTSAAKKKVKKLNDDIKNVKKEVESINDQIISYEDQLEDAQTKNAKETERAATPKEDGTTEAPKLIDINAIKQQIRSLNKELTKKNEELADKQSQLAEQEAIVSANKDVKVSESTKAQINASSRLSSINVNDAQESLDVAEAGITAKKAGIVESVDVVKGAYANETQTLLTVIDTDSVGVEFTISKDDLGSVTKGQKARVVIAGNEYEGTVDYVSRVAVTDMNFSGSNTNSGGTIKGRILIDNADEGIYIGVSAKAYIFVGKSEQALVIPYEALNTDIDGDFVYVVNSDNLIERKGVTLGICSDEYYEVVDGLTEGDKVITKVTSDMKPGDVYVGNAVGIAVAE